METHINNISVAEWDFKVTLLRLELLGIMLEVEHLYMYKMHQRT